MKWSKVYILFDLFTGGGPGQGESAATVGGDAATGGRVQAPATAEGGGGGRVQKEAWREHHHHRGDVGVGDQRHLWGVTSQEGTDSCVLCVCMSSRCLHVRRLWYG